MNKKIISVFLIVSLLTVGLTSVTANETAQTSSDDAPVTSTENIKDSTPNNEPVVTGSSSENNQSFVSTANENLTENETNAIYSINDTNNSNAKYSKFITLLNKLDYKDANELLAILSSSNNTNIVKLSEALVNYNDDDLAPFIDALNNLNDDEFDAVMTLLYILTDDSSNSTTPASHTQSRQKVSYSDKILSTGDSTSNNNIINAIFAPKKSSKIFPKNSKHDESQFDLFNEIINDYFEGDITFEKMVQVLDLLGYDTSGIKLNADGSFVWDGLLFTKNGIQEVDQAVINDNNSTNVNSNNTSVADNTEPTNDNTNDNTDNADIPPIKDDSKLSSNDKVQSTSNASA